jgi:hypothetical protein
LEYWPIPFGVLQTCCKIQKYKKIIFFVFKKSMRKHIFETSNICFFYKTKRSKHVRVLAVCSIQENIFYIFVETQTSQLDAPWLEPLRGPNGLDLRRLKKTSKWKVASHHTYYKNYKKLETIRNKNRSRPNQLKIL